MLDELRPHADSIEHVESVAKPQLLDQKQLR
jgi:hypothetical protein